MRNRYSIIFGFVIILSFATKVMAGGFQINMQGQKALGMGGAFTGMCGDASTLYFNPAGVVNLKDKSSLILGVSYILPKMSVQTASVGNTNSTSPHGNPIQLYYVYKINEHAGFGFAVNNQFGSAVSYPDEWEGKFIVQKLSLKTFMYQPSFMYSINKYASFGLGYVMAYGDFGFQKAIPLGNNSIKHGQVNLSGSSSSKGFNAGFFSNPFEDVTVGVSYRSAMNMKINGGKAEFTGIPSSLTDIFPDATTFNSSLSLPAVLSSGVAFHLDSAKRILIVFDAVRTYWSSYDSLKFDFANEKTPDSRVGKLWRNTMTYRFGCAVNVYKNLTLRGGMYFDETPIPTGYVSPETVDNTHTGFSLGAGYSFSPNFMMDVAWLRSDLKRDGSLDSEGFTALYHRVVNVFGVSANMKF